jgi:hypothetical protein
VPFLRPLTDAKVVGCGSTTTISSSASRPRRISDIRVTVLPPWPNVTKALMLLGWSSSPGFASTASNQRVVGTPFVSISSLEAKRPFSQS